MRWHAAPAGLGFIAQAPSTVQVESSTTGLLLVTPEPGPCLIAAGSPAVGQAEVLPSAAGFVLNGRPLNTLLSSMPLGLVLVTVT